MARTPWPVPPIASPGALADRLALAPAGSSGSPTRAGWSATAADPRLRHYSYVWLPRPGAPPRPIARPKPRLKAIQRWILHEILDRVPAHDAAHGFVRGRSARTHAALHAGRDTVLRLDLEDFFASVRRGARLRHLPHRRLPPGGRARADGAVHHRRPARRSGRPAAAADPALIRRHHRLGRRLATPHLPQGAPTSPALASLAATGLDRRLAGARAGALRDLLALRRRPHVLGRRRHAGRHAPPRRRRDRARGGLPRRAGQDPRPPPPRPPARLRRRGQRARERAPARVDRLKSTLHDAAPHGAAGANRDGRARLPRAPARPRRLGRPAAPRARPPAARRLDAIEW